MRDVVKEAVVEVSKGELLLEDFRKVFKENSRRKAVLEVCKNDGREAGGADSLVRKRCVKAKALFLEKMTFWSEKLEKAG